MKESKDFKKAMKKAKKAYDLLKEASDLFSTGAETEDIDNDICYHHQIWSDSVANDIDEHFDVTNVQHQVFEPKKQAKSSEVEDGIRRTSYPNPEYEVGGGEF